MNVKSRTAAMLISTLMILNLAGCSSDTKAQAETGTASENTTEITEETAETGGAEVKTLAYESSLFDTSYVHEINVEISAEDWADLLENPTDKTKYEVNITIDGTTVEGVSFATKGNTSLSSVAMTDSDRYSFKVNFGKFNKGQTYDGLNKLNLNNIYADATYMKDYISYRIMDEAGVASPLVSYVHLTVNGEEQGLYLAIEDISTSFLERNYGEDYGELYKPDSTGGMGGGGGGMPNMEDWDGEMPDMGEWSGEMPGQPEGDIIPETSAEAETQSNEETAIAESDTAAEQNAFMPGGNGEFTMPEDWDGTMPEGMGGGMGGGFGQTGSASLVYTDDEIESYADIFDDAETKPIDEDKERLIASLKQLSTGEDLETCVDVEAVLRYFAAHNFVISYDSYTGNMLHNYYLYEDDGVLTMLPWDYNLAFGAYGDGSMGGMGGFGGSDSTGATSTVNTPIDTPLSSGVSEENRPMWSQLVSNEEYLELYHQYFDELISGYFESGRFEEEIASLYELIRPYVETDATAFFTVDEFDTAVETLKSFCLLRAESVRSQLDGTIPSTTDGQSADSSTLVDASDINISDMGSMNMGFGGDREGGFGGDREGGFGGFGGNRDGNMMGGNQNNQGASGVQGEAQETPDGQSAEQSEQPTTSQ